MEDVPVLLTKLKIDNCEIELLEPLIFLGVLLHENLYWKEYFKYTKNRTTEDILGWCIRQSHTKINNRFHNIIIYRYIPALTTD